MTIPALVESIFYGHHQPSEFDLDDLEWPPRLSHLIHDESYSRQTSGFGNNALSSVAK